MDRRERVVNELFHSMTTVLNRGYCLHCLGRGRLVCNTAEHDRMCDDERLRVNCSKSNRYGWKRQVKGWCLRSVGLCFWCWCPDRIDESWHRPGNRGDGCVFNDMLEVVLFSLVKGPLWDEIAEKAGASLVLRQRIKADLNIFACLQQGNYLTKEPALTVAWDYEKEKVQLHFLLLSELFKKVDL